MLAVVLKTGGKDEISLAEIVDDGVNDRPDGHLAVAGDLRLAAEGEEIAHPLVLQNPPPEQGCGEVIRHEVADQNLNNEAQGTLPRRLLPTEKDVATGEVPDQAAEGVVDDGSEVLADAAEVEQQEHQAGAEYEIEDADNDVAQEHLVNKLLNVHKITMCRASKKALSFRLYTMIRQNARFFSPYEEDA